MHVVVTLTAVRFPDPLTARSPALDHAWTTKGMSADMEDMMEYYQAQGASSPSSQAACVRAVSPPPVASNPERLS